MLKYRTDIDGLRAIAVGGVVIFHAFPNALTGGFVGVDLFFVLSGFLITANIVSDTKSGEFSIFRFYERRFRRILPALVAMVVLTTVAAILILPPTELRGYGKALVGVSLFTSNIIFWRDSGYFETVSADKPLLHTWSLSVEEQFYIIWPLVASFLVKMEKKWLLSMVVWLTVSTSLVAATYWVAYNPSSAFYLLPFRAWELGMGALLATGSIPAIVKQRSREIAAWSGLALILVPMIFYTEKTLFPGLSALPPCLGAMLIVHAGQGAQTQIGRIISWRPVLFLGLVSYSFYLWHWPLLVLSRIAINRPLQIMEAALMVAMALALAAVSLRYVERPFRGRGTIPLSQKRVLWGSFGICSLLVFLGASLFITNGLKAFARRDVIAAEGAVNSINPWRKACHNDAGTSTLGPVQRCTGGAKNPQNGYQVLLWGDSHADHLAAGLDRLGRTRGFSFRQASVSGCSPLAIFDKSARRVSCGEFHRKILAEAAMQPDLKTILISARWSTMLATKTASAAMSHDKDELLRVRLNKLVGLIRHKVGPRPQIIFVGSTPEFSFWPATCLARAAMSGLGKEGCSNAIASDTDRSLRADYMLAHINGAEAVLPRKDFCDGQHCKTVRNGVIMYRDDDHLTNEGSWVVIKRVSGFLNR